MNKAAVDVPLVTRRTSYKYSGIEHCQNERLAMRIRVPTFRSGWVEEPLLLCHHALGASQAGLKDGFHIHDLWLLVRLIYSEMAPTAVMKTLWIWKVVGIKNHSDGIIYKMLPYPWLFQSLLYRALSPRERLAQTPPPHQVQVSSMGRVSPMLPATLQWTFLRKAGVGHRLLWRAPLLTLAFLIFR